MFSLEAIMFTKEIEQAHLTRAALLERLERLNQDLVATQAAIRRAEAEERRLAGYVEGLEKISQVSTAEHANEQGPSTESRTKRASNPSRSQVASSVLKIIAEEGRPMTRAELFSRLEAEGVEIEGKDPMMVFSTMLWRERERVARIRGVGYWPADKPYPPAGYYPQGQAALL
jgi:hypothetical protein